MTRPGDYRLRVFFCFGGPTVLAREMDLCDDFADEGLEFGWGRCDLEGFAEHGFGFVEECRVFAEEGDEGLVGFEFVA